MSLSPSVRPGPFFILRLQAYWTLTFAVNDNDIDLQTLGSLMFDVRSLKLKFDYEFEICSSKSRLDFKV